MILEVDSQWRSLSLSIKTFVHKEKKLEAKICLSKWWRWLEQQINIKHEINLSLGGFSLMSLCVWFFSTCRSDLVYGWLFLNGNPFWDSELDADWYLLVSVSNDFPHWFQAMRKQQLCVVNVCFPVWSGFMLDEVIVQVENNRWVLL